LRKKGEEGGRKMLHMHTLWSQRFFMKGKCKIIAMKLINGMLHWEEHKEKFLQIQVAIFVGPLGIG
jgi:hypothetical protein